MIEFKAGVNIFGIRPELILAMLVAEQAYEKYEYDFVVTSITDGEHRKDSLHYVGAAFDCRTKHMEALDVFKVTNEIKSKLPADTFDIIPEDDHIHIEFQPKRYFDYV